MDFLTLSNLGGIVINIDFESKDPSLVWTNPN